MYEHEPMSIVEMQRVLDEAEQSVRTAHEKLTEAGRYLISVLVKLNSLQISLMDEARNTKSDSCWFTRADGEHCGVLRDKHYGQIINFPEHAFTEENA